MMRRRSLLGGLAALPMAPAWGRPPARPDFPAGPVVASARLPGIVSYARLDGPGDGLGDAALAMAPMIPASTLKTVTALYALAMLGRARTFATRVIRSGDMLVLAGGGDPVLTTDDLARLAADLAATGLSTPARFGVWGGALPRIPEIAPDQADHLAYNPALSGMILNFNRVHLGWRQGGAQMSVEARAADHSPRAYTITAAPADQADPFDWQDRAAGEGWTVARTATARPGSRWLPVRKPELYAGDVFQTLCRAKGLVLPAPQVIDDLPPGQVVASHSSPSLDEILRGMLFFSTNLTAEAVGLHASGAADPAASARAMQAWLGAQGQGQDFTLSDHSGLSFDNRVTAQGMVRLLAGPGVAAGLPDLLKLNPLDDDKDQRAAQSAPIRAKTGTLNFVSNLAGYLRRPDGTQSAFAILCSDVPRQKATAGQDLPAGVLSWTRQAKQLQRDMLAIWS
ncbi:peptidase S13 [Paracoccus sediminis]|uniref:D-alanyl-D-alanine carboxypeptidase / D-alanyl-D-alanine-endopeptidase (Penicillin-binding protein 4) n=1 Tax=Paracoccus sediminis TaxID=1214787 RepID=A0A238XES5_9RHOB|nr:D-alanyl-D-alanine carboxypeptidase [Paracoccus sediminis]TBN49671.1 peptidase S13 [Paracoccus sediminis]SNR57061.1 D-alanyl-D-alanine carboxypeptidase / D-alanyl-D-alanine-endopeptidase (penicillin-binding protein 4) [Paracoccus sediminis]